jgi:hypothetical protein
MFWYLNANGQHQIILHLLFSNRAMTQSFSCPLEAFADASGNLPVRPPVQFAFFSPTEGNLHQRLTGPKLKTESAKQATNVIAPQSDSHQMQEQNNCDPNEN